MRVIHISLLFILFVACAGGCKQKEPTQLDSMTSFEFFYGGYHGPTHHIYVDTEQEEKRVFYGLSNSGELLNVRNMDEQDLSSDQRVEEIILTEKEWNAFVAEFANLEIDQWEQSYDRIDVMDGIQWSIDIQRSDKDRIRKSGSNDYPSNWGNLEKLLNKYLEVEL